MATTLRLFRTLCLLGAAPSSNFSFVSGFAPSPRADLARSMTVSTSTSSAVASSATDGDIAGSDAPSTLSVAILGGGIAGLSCASHLLSQHQQHSSHAPSTYNLEVTVFDTGRLRPGGRCSSRLPGDEPPPEVKNRSSGKFPPKKRACDAEGGPGNGTEDDPNSMQVPENIQRALDGSDNSSRDRIISSLGAVDHAAQILSIPQLDSDMEGFRAQLHTWLEEGTIESFPVGSVCELLDENEDVMTLRPVEGDMYYGKGGMGNVPLALREHCLSLNDPDTGRSFRILQDVWVSPSNGVKYVGNKEDVDPTQPQWELRAGKKSLGQYHKLVIAHNGKCADRIMSKTPARAFHSLLRTKFAPYVPQWGGKEMTLNSIYSLVFAVKTDRGEGTGGMGGLTSPIAQALSNLSKEKDVYTVMIQNEPTLRLLSCNTLKHHHNQTPNAESNVEVYTLLSSAKFGKKFKGPQENLPLDLSQKVTLKMLEGLERALHLTEGSVAESIVDLKLQLWGAAVPMNTWQTSSAAADGRGADGFVYDAKFGVGACGDWILDPSVAGAWESGRRLADWMLRAQVDGGGGSNMSVGLPDRSSKEGGGKFVPSRVALESGIGNVPSSPGAKRSDRRESDARPRTPRQPNGSRNNSGRGGRGRSGGRGRGKGRVAEPVSQ